jgi:hypothetical protein
MRWNHHHAATGEAQQPHHLCVVFCVFVCAQRGGSAIARHSGALTVTVTVKRETPMRQDGRRAGFQITKSKRKYEIEVR